jgi:hypothetical protein
MKAKRKATAKLQRRGKIDTRKKITEPVLPAPYAPPELQEGDASHDPGTSPNLLYTIYKKDGKSSVTS